MNTNSLLPLAYYDEDEEREMVQDAPNNKEATLNQSLSETNIESFADTSVSSLSLSALNSASEKRLTEVSTDLHNVHVNSPQSIQNLIALENDHHQIQWKELTKVVFPPPLTCEDRDFDHRVKLVKQCLKKKNELSLNINEHLKASKPFRNPNIYAKLIEFCNINEYGTNRNTVENSEIVYYEELQEQQKVFEQKKQRMATQTTMKNTSTFIAERFSKAKVMFDPTGSHTEDSTKDMSSESGNSRRSRFDVGGPSASQHNSFQRRKYQHDRQPSDTVANPPRTVRSFEHRRESHVEDSPSKKRRT